MADLSDVTAYLLQAATDAVYPNGAARASIVGAGVRLMEGWPIAKQLDADMAAGKANVSVFPPAGAGTTVYQVLDKTYVIQPAAIATTFTLAGNVITVAGTLAPGEFMTLVIDGAVACSQTGTSVADMLAKLAAQAQSFGYPAVATSNTLAVPFGHELVVRQGGKAVEGKVVHRQQQSVWITVWAPTPTMRNALAAAIDVAIKSKNRVTMPDTSQALVVYSRTNTVDEQQAATIYRRDLIFNVDYATIEQFPAYTITSTQVSIAKPGNTAIATAVT
ncbi:hypothetical protein [Bradyrhizobium sp. SZCCHNR3015]|uniref:hypothetical protein n=1 Tax=Bradyrhizobium sp. SZCCHNR3015 TaxID=3057395 RepID=UPI0029168A8B|nr:hypothetical protein [Bradyrhizobium sp. SZCCHNR3015]